VSDVMNLVAQFWEQAQVVRVFGFLHYYRPLVIARTGALPAGDMTVLAVIAIACWLAGLWHFARRDIPAQ